MIIVSQTWNNLGVASINRGNELLRHGGAQIAYTQARNAPYKALSRARGIKAEDALPGQGFDDVMANIETLQSECEAHAGRDAAQALRSLPPRTFNFDTVRPLLVQDVHGDASAHDDADRITVGSDDGASDRDGHEGHDADSDVDADGGIAGGSDRRDGDGDDGGDGVGDSDGDGGSDTDDDGDGGSNDEKNVDKLAPVAPKLSSRMLCQRRRGRACDSTGLSARSRAPVSLINVKT